MDTRRRVASRVSTEPLPLSIMIVGYNSADCIADCLSSIPSACAAVPYEVLFVDNGDGATERVVAERFPDVRIVASRGNVGFAAGNNLLAAEARGERLLLLNPDVELRPGAVDALLEGSRRHPQSVAWGGVTLGRDGEPDPGNSVHVPSLREMASRVLGRSTARLATGDPLDRDARVEALSGSFVMIERSAWDAVGGLDERYFLYCEEVDIFYRLARRGETFTRIGAARAFHDVGHGEAISPTRMLYRAAGTMEFARQHWSPPKRMAAFLLLWSGAWLRYVAGKTLGLFRPRLRTIGKAHAMIARHPSQWRHGYHPQRGLKPRP